jgi:hypothetical protein
VLLLENVLHPVVVWREDVGKSLNKVSKVLSVFHKNYYFR